jgi:transcriptional antiterminator RfaH
MPLLPPEPSLYPEDLFQQEQRSTDDEHRWWVLHTRPRSEKSLARAAHEDRTTFFLPLYTHRWRKNGRLFKSTLPLFPGYFFVHTNGPGWLRLRETGWVANVLPVADQARLDRDLARLHSVVAAGVPLAPEQHLQKGTRVRVTTGPLSGVEGTVVRQQGKMRLLIEVHFMQQGASMEVEPWMVTPVESMAPNARVPQRA